MSLMMAWCLALGAAGCQTTTTTVATGPNAHAPSGAVIAKSNEPPRKPKAETIVTLAKTRADQGDDKNQTSEMQIKWRDEARKYYQEALKLDANCISAYRGLAQVYLKLNDSDRAIETIHTAIKLNPKSGTLWSDLAMCHNCRKEFEQAVQCLNKAIELEPENRQFARTLGLTLARSGRIEPSLAVLGKAYGQDNAHYTVARMLYQLNQDDACKEQLRLALAANPNHRDAREMLSTLEQGGNTSAPLLPAALAQPSVDPQLTVRSSAE